MDVKRNEKFNFSENKYKKQNQIKDFFFTKTILKIYTIVFPFIQ